MKAKFNTGRGAGLAVGCLIVAMGVLNAAADEPRPAPSSGDKSVENRVRETAPVTGETLEARPVHRGVSYGGALYEMAKADQPLQILNPAAPKKYGSGEKNIVRDPLTKQARGVALFSLHW